VLLIDQHEPQEHESLIVELMRSLHQGINYSC
jgi:hypothetical protein